MDQPKSVSIYSSDSSLDSSHQGYTSTPKPHELNCQYPEPSCDNTNISNEEIELSCVLPKKIEKVVCNLEEEEQQKDESFKRNSLVRDVKRTMGRMLGKQPGQSEKTEASSGSAVSDEPTRRQKFNSLSRILNNPFADKNTDAKVEQNQRGLSLTRILKRNNKIPPETSIASVDVKPDKGGIFSRIIGQIRGKVAKSSEKASGCTSEKDKEQIEMTSIESNFSELSLGNVCPVPSPRNEE